MIQMIQPARTTSRSRLGAKRIRNSPNVSRGWLDAATLQRATLYTSTEPCVMCCGAIYWSRIRQVVFACTAAALGDIAGGSLVIPSRELFSRARRPVEVVGPILESEALAVHQAYWGTRGDVRALVSTKSPC